MTPTDKIPQTLRDSAGMRWLVLLLLAFAMFCSYIFMDILSPIKDLMQSTRGWDSTAFGTMQGSETFLNVFVFFLIFAGIILDKMGVRFTAILSGAVMLVGATINWYAVTDAFQGSGLQTWFTNNLNYIPGFDELGISPFYRGMPASAKFAAIGFMIFGCGVEMAGITVSRGIVKWFKGREMALAMGSEMALARLGVATCMIFSPVFAKLGGVIDVSRSVAFGVVLLLIALIMFIVYFFMDRKLDAQTGEAEEKDDPFKISDLGTILSSSGFWLVALLCVLYYSAIFPFQKYAVNMLQCNLVFNEVRRQKRKPTTSADAMEEEGGMAVFLEPSQTPDEALEHTELQHAVDAAIAALPEKARLAVQLRRFENMPYEEIARALDMTVPATKSLLFRARNMLKEALASFLS